MDEGGEGRDRGFGEKKGVCIGHAHSVRTECVHTYTLTHTHTDRPRHRQKGGG